MADKVDGMGGPAFPSEQHECQDGTWNQTFDPGMSTRQFAAIKLRVPDSGTDWLDDMIRRARRDDFAAQELSSGCDHGYTPDSVAERSFALADAMVVESDKAAKDNETHSEKGTQ